jgi:hypothetical protein
MYNIHVQKLHTYEKWISYNFYYQIMTGKVYNLNKVLQFLKINQIPTKFNLLANFTCHKNLSSNFISQSFANYDFDKKN